MSEYVDFMFLRQGQSPWCRMLIGHNRPSSILDDETFGEYMQLNDMACYKETLQVKKTCKVGWLLGSLPRAFNTKEFEEGLATIEELYKFQLELHVEPIKTKIGPVPAREFIKAAHIWTSYDKA